MPAQKPKKSVQSQPKPTEKRVAKSLAHSSAAKAVDKSTAKTPTKPNPKVQAVPATKSPANHGPSATPEAKKHAPLPRHPKWL
ncbi:MAG: hypothetical protein IPF55_06620 [Rhodoferax sp.]|nr:hypothetical protein [Rhodoferax sp.]